MEKTAYFDRVAESEDPLLFRDEDHAKMEGLHRRLGNLSGLRVLEPGCGAGPLTSYLSIWVGPNGRVDAFDPSASMIRLARMRLTGALKVALTVGRMEEFQGNGATWDIIILFRVFPHIDDKAGTLRLLRSLVKPDGRLVIANLEGSARLNQIHAGFSEAVRHDHMPCDYGTSRLLEENGWRVLEAQDQPDEFFVAANPV